VSQVGKNSGQRCFTATIQSVNQVEFFEAVQIIRPREITENSIAFDLLDTA